MSGGCSASRPRRMSTRQQFQQFAAAVGEAFEETQSFVGDSSCACRPTRPGNQ